MCDTMELFEVKLDIIYYGVRLSNECYKSLKHDKCGNVIKNDYITTKGLYLILNNEVYVSAPIKDNSYYLIDFDGKTYSLFKNGKFITETKIIQPRSFALNNETLENGELISNLVNIHGDRLRLQPIAGCAFRCKFCDLNSIPYQKKDIKYLDEAFTLTEKRTEFRHVLISGGTPRLIEEDYEYLNNVYKYFGEKYGKKYPIDVMLVPRGLRPSDNNVDGYKNFLMALKSWNITGLSINIELFNNDARKRIIKAKDVIGKDNYAHFIKEAVKVFGADNVRSCIIVGLEDISDTLEGVRYLASLGISPVLSPYVPIDDSIKAPTPEFMEEVLLKSFEITESYGVKLGPSCDFCKHNTINFK